MSELDITALVAAEVKKQLGARNSLPNVKRAAVTVDEWKGLVIIEAWDLMIGKFDDAKFLQMPAGKSKRISITGDTLKNAAFNVNAPARFGKEALNLFDYPEYFEFGKVYDEHTGDCRVNVRLK